MKPLKILSSTLLFSALFIFSCEEAKAPFEKKELSHTELLLIVEEMPEFQEYARTSYVVIDSILKRRKAISKKEFDWVANIHAKFPTLNRLRGEATDKVLLRYHELTTIDVKNGDKVAGTQFDVFLSALQEQYNYQIDDLTEVLFTLKGQNTPEKAWGNCMSWCFLYTATEQNSLFNTCMDAQVGLPSRESLCRQDADFAFRYLFRGCTSGCPQDE